MVCKKNRIFRADNNQMRVADGRWETEKLYLEWSNVSECDS